MEPREPGAEPLKQVLVRNVAIALSVGLVLALSSRNLRAFPLATLLALWFSLGGHYVELAYLRLARPLLIRIPLLRVFTRLLVWFVGGVVLGGGMALTLRLAIGRWRAPFAAWYWSGVAFVGLELFVHGLLALRRLPSFYNGRG